MLAEILGAAKIATLRIRYRPGNWSRFPTRAEFEYRLPIASAALRWMRRNVGRFPTILAGGSMGAMISARLADQPDVAGVVLVSPPFVHPQTGEAYLRWAQPMLHSRCPKLVIVGNADPIWTPLDVVRRVLAQWARPCELHVLKGAGHSMAGFEDRLRSLVCAWLRRHAAAIGLDRGLSRR